MPVFAIFCSDKPDQVAKRAEHREAHVEHLKAHRDALLTVGPLQAEDRSHSVGSLLIVDMPDRAAVEAFCAADPFAEAGIFESVVIRPFKGLEI